VNGTKQLVFSMTNGIQSVLGELIAKNQKEELIKTFNASEWSIHTITTYIFGCTAMLILPFISVYTKGINDADYYIPLFALLITFANAGHCLRLPYNLMIQAAGHYKQTQNNFIIAAAMNIIISVILVVFKGLIGVAIGTLFAMLYQTIWMAWYNSKNIIAIPFMQFWKQFALDIITIVLIRICTSGFTLQSLTYASWVILACKVALISAVIVIAVNMIFKREYLIVFLNKILYKKRER
jgi:O-antigen/teichoic acid export membrane protein